MIFFQRIPVLLYLTYQPVFGIINYNFSKGKMDEWPAQATHYVSFIPHPPHLCLVYSNFEYSEMLRVITVDISNNVCDPIHGVFLARFGAPHDVSLNIICLIIERWVSKESSSIVLDFVRGRYHLTVVRQC